MTAPFAPPPPRPLQFMMLGALIIAIAMPFARRVDWIGWIAFLAITILAMGFWLWVIWSFTRVAFDRMRNK